MLSYQNWDESEVALALLLLHTCLLVKVNHTGCALRLGCGHHLLHYLLNGRCVAFHRTCQWPASQSAEANHTVLNLWHIFLGQAVIVSHYQVAVYLHTRTLLGEIKGNDGDILQTDILPDIKLGPVAQGEHTNALALVYAAVIDIPLLWTLVLGVPLVELVTEAEDTLLGS